MTGRAGLLEHGSTGGRLVGRVKRGLGGLRAGMVRQQDKNNGRDADNGEDFELLSHGGPFGFPNFGYWFLLRRNTVVEIFERMRRNSVHLLLTFAGSHGKVIRALQAHNAWRRIPFIESKRVEFVLEKVPCSVTMLRRADTVSIGMKLICCSLSR